MPKIIEDGVMQGLSCLQNSAFGSSCSWMTCMDGCLTEYFQRVTYVDFFKRTIVVGRELPFSSFQLEYFCGRQLVVSDGSDDVAFKVMC